VSIKMDFGYCEDAITFDRLTSLRRSLCSRGFTFNEVSDKALARAIEVYGESPPEGFDVIKWQGPCKEKCPKCMDAYKRFRSGRWYLRGNAACEAAIAKGAHPMFLTLVFPDVGYEFTETEEVEAFQSLKEALFGAKLAACRLEIAKSMKANPDNYGLDYDPDAVAEQRAASGLLSMRVPSFKSDMVNLLFGSRRVPVYKVLSLRRSMLRRYQKCQVHS